MTDLFETLGVLMSAVSWLLLGLGTWVIWEWILSVIPFRVHAAIQPLIVMSIAALLYRYADNEILGILAVTACTAILHAFSRACIPETARTAVPSIGKRRVQRVPDLPR